MRLRGRCDCAHARPLVVARLPRTAQKSVCEVELSCATLQLIYIELPMHAETAMRCSSRSVQELSRASFECPAHHSAHVRSSRHVTSPQTPWSCLRGVGAAVLRVWASVGPRPEVLIWLEGARELVSSAQPCETTSRSHPCHKVCKPLQSAVYVCHCHRGVPHRPAPRPIVPHRMQARQTRASARPAVV